jgi:hypothetical protein
MMELRRKTEREGGPFHIQETTKSGRERTIPVKELSRGADSSMTFAMLLAAVYAWYKAHSEAAPVNYDLTTYVPKKRSFDAWGVVEGFTMRDNSVQTWDQADEGTRRTWLIRHGLSRIAAGYPWAEQSSKVQNAFIDWCRANHNV